MKSSKNLLLIFILILFANYLEAKILKVGVYSNEPKIYIDKNLNPSGFYIDLLKEIANNENWQLKYVNCNWNECLNKLNESEIDILIDVAYSKNREELYNFSNEAILYSWSVIYKNKASNISSIVDLKDKKIAVIKESIQYESLKKRLYDFKVNANFIEVNTFDEAFNLVKNGICDGALVNRFYGIKNFDLYDAEKTDILIKPSTLKFAYPKNSDNFFKDTIDKYLENYKNDNNSIYYTSYKKWLTPYENKTFPNWIKYLIISLIGIVLLFILFNYFCSKSLINKIKENKYKDEILSRQTKHVFISNMLNTIAYQWKHPLNIIGVNSTGLKSIEEFDVNFTKNEKISMLNEIYAQVQYLSQTIENFKKLFNENETRQLITLKLLMNNTLEIINSNLKKDNIIYTINYNNLDNESINIYKSELAFVFINVINFLEIVLKEQKIKKSSINIEISKDSESLKFNFSNDDISLNNSDIEAIFDKENEKNKFSSLYLSKEMIMENFKGEIEIFHKEVGLRFQIKLKSNY